MTVGMNRCKKEQVKQLTWDQGIAGKMEELV